MSSCSSRGTAPVALITETFGVSRQAVYAERAKARAPVASSAPSTNPSTPTQCPPPGSSGPRGVPTDELVAAIKAVVDAFPAWGVRKVWAIQRRKHLRVSRRRVHALMRSPLLLLPRSSDETREGAPRGYVMTPLPNWRIAADFTTVSTVVDGVVAIMLAVDCGCRGVVDVTVSKPQAAGSVDASVDRALEAAFSAPKNAPHGVELRTDYGPQYTGHDAEVLCAAGGVTHTYAPVGRPTGNAVAESTIRTMKEECIWLRDWPDAETLPVALVAWAATFNGERPHRALNWQTPSERRTALLGVPQRRAA
jgi:putative transposase